MKKSLLYIVAIILTAFGLLTLFLSSSIIFDLFGVREKEGNYVLFVVWANFFCSWLYLLSAYGFVYRKKWTTKLLFTASLLLVTTLIGFVLYIKAGGLHETKTIGALIFRSSITLVFSTISYFTLSKNKV